MNATARENVTLPSPEEILVTRVFAAPKDLIYQAWTKPELLRRWWCGQRGTMTITEIDLRVGGRWRYGMVTHDGQEVIFSGMYREVVPYERIVYTERLGTGLGAEAETTVTFTEAEGATRVAILVRYGSRRDRDSHRQYMADGLHEALDLLELVSVERTSA